VDGVQYLSVMAGWGGSAALWNAPGSGPVKPGYGRILTFRIDGTATLKAPAFGHKEPPPMPEITTDASPKIVHEGEMIFNTQCAGCHGVNAVAGPLPDLRYAGKQTLQGIEGIVLGGSRASLGMPSFQKILNPVQVHAIQAYIITRARESARKNN
jgi:mono/diheme cytochrome c family protein